MRSSGTECAQQLTGAGIDGLVDGSDAQGLTQVPCDVLRNPSQLGNLSVGEAVPLCLTDEFGVEVRGVTHLFSDLIDDRDLVKEPGVNPSGFVQPLSGCAQPHRLLNLLDATVMRRSGLLDERLDVVFDVCPAEGCI